ncbi:velvet factor-domain-containing protein [Roridomyces roridus]|uniref:Velvet factor-domain-containing protein n=1 Tax=Roridomyces roridus TaxID=1738132 RepID=A0AAD7BKC2_9AGAR|nr:velvet factor-domain-containing protein [Roridomyces roridus]
MSFDPPTAGVSRRPTHRARTGCNPKTSLSSTSLMNSVTKMRNLRHVHSSKTYTRLNITITRKNPSSTCSSSSGHSSPQTTASSLAFSSNGSSSSRSTPSSRNSVQEYSTHRPQLRSNPRLQLSSLLAENQNRSYQLNVVQHPQKTAEFGHARLSRLPLTPPLVVQMTVRDANGNSIVPENELPFLIAHLSLFTENGLTPLDMGSSPTGSGLRPGMAQPILYGNLVSSVNHLEDQNGNMGLFFIFPDVSIKWRGRFQLGINLVSISRRVADKPDSSGIADQGATLAQARTSTFEVLPHHEYVAAPPTRLTQAFLRQGARMLS